MKDIVDPIIDPERIKVAKIRLNAISNELGFTAETNDPILVAYFLADAAIADALAHTKLSDKTPNSEDGKRRIKLSNFSLKRPKTFGRRSGQSLISRSPC